MRSRTPSVGVLLAMGAISVAIADHGASANGAFPSSGQILVHPSPSQAFDVRTSYGLVRSIDGGLHYRFLCEAGMGYGNGFHPQMGLTPSGLLFMGLPDGLAVEADGGCSFRRAPELEGNDVVDVSVDVNGRLLALAIPPSGDAFVSASTDSGATWSALGMPLPPKFQPLTVDAAKSDTTHVYVSGILGAVSPKGALVASLDGGATWSTTLIDGSTNTSAPFIAAIDPVDAERVFVRLHGAPGELLVTEDGGTTFQGIFTAVGFLRAFALSPDGTYALFGGDTDGVRRLDTSTYETTPLSSLGAKCLSIRGADVYACADEGTDGFSAGLSHDGGATFEPLLHQQCIEGPVDCPMGSPVDAACTMQWPIIKAQLGVTDCSAGGASASSGAAATTTGAGAAGGSAPTPPPAGDGCACNVTASSSDAWTASGFLALAAALGARRRRR